MKSASVTFVALSFAVAVLASPAAAADELPLPRHLRDRGTGVATSMFGTYIRRGELMVYPFYEHYRDQNFEYKPEEFGFRGDRDFRGRYRANEGLIFLGYGLTDDLAFEFEAAVIRASLQKSASDPSGLPSRIEESGLGDVESQIRWRFWEETGSRPELFSYGEVVFPSNRNKLLIGTRDVELKLGTGLIRGYGWGTMTLRAAVQYEGGSTSQIDLGEYALEVLRRVSPSVRLYAGLEGTQDELGLIAEVQWQVHDNVIIKLNNSVGLTSKATDWAPEVGILFTLPVGR